MASILCRGHAVVPSVPLSSWVDVDWWQDFLGPGRPSDIAVDLGTKVAPDWAGKIRQLKGLRRVFAEPRLRLVAYGVSVVDRVRDVVSAWQGRVLFAALEPAAAALRGGKRLSVNDLEGRMDMRYSRKDLVQINAEAFEAAVARATGFSLTTEAYRAAG